MNKVSLTESSLFWSQQLKQEQQSCTCTQTAVDVGRGEASQVTVVSYTGTRQINSDEQLRFSRSVDTLWFNHQQLQHPAPLLLLLNCSAVRSV